MAISNNDYLRFSAYSIKDLITRKLSDNTKFTDQVYEGSNLAILIDIVSYMYQCLIYNVNNAAAESMWADTQIYENINRLCKFIGYNPKGYSTAMCTVTLDNSSYKYSSMTIPKYAYIDTGKTDTRGKKVYYSTDQKHVVTVGDSHYNMTMYNGRWKLYSTIFTSSGDPYQTFKLDGVYSDSDATNPMYVPNNMIHVYVQKTPDDNIEQWSIAEQGLFTDNRVENGSQIYTAIDTIYDVRLNEDKTYEITFGNDFNGMIPYKGSLIYVFYLDSNGPDGMINVGDISDKKIQHSAETFGITTDIYDKLFNGEITDDFIDTLSQEGKWKNSFNSTDVSEEETVDEIRHNAPQWFKLGNRLITTDDWEYYIKNVFRKNNIIDVKCQNNWAYISTFYNWLYNLGVTQHNNGKYYITQTKLTKYAKYSDAVDCNNVYLWIKMKDDADIYSDIFDDKVQNVKALTQEPVYLKPLTVKFCICAEDTEYARQRYFDDANTSNEFDPDCLSYLEITVDDNIMYSTSDIYNQVIRIINNFFDETNFTLGQMINYNKLSDQILAIQGVNRIRTVYYNPDDEYEQQRIVSGISFATWTDSFIDLGDDLDVSNTSRALECFQFPSLYRKDQLNARIKIVKKSISTLNTVQY